MLLCPDSNGYLCITQPAHAWVAGQLARAWGNDQFGCVFPREEVCLASEQHDIGWLPWEVNPLLNPETGYPYHFTELPTAAHVHIWSGARSFIQSFGRYVALLVSLHGTGIYKRHTSWQQYALAKPLVEAFLANEIRFQQQTITQLKQSLNYADWVSDLVLERNRALIASWDWLSILLCVGFDHKQKVPGVPTATAASTLNLISVGDRRFRQVIVSPWPFQNESVTLRIEGRSLSRPVSNQVELKQALADAPHGILEILLIAH